MLGTQYTGKKILIIEDNEMNMKLFNDLLGSHGFEIIEARDGLNARQLIKTIKPDIVIMDIQLPEVSGIDVIKEIKSDPATAHYPIIAVTAFAMKDNEDQILESGCDAYVSKPISIENFLATLSKFLKKAS